MTKRGYFIINGIPRVVLNQIIRRSGIYYQQSIHKILKSNKIRIKRHLYVDLISQRGTWLRFEMDKRKKIWARLKKTPRIPVSLLLHSIGFTKKTILQTILDSNSFSPLSESKQKRPSLGLLRDLILPSEKNTEISLEAGKEFVYRKFLNPRSYNLGKTGRSQLNHKFGYSIPINRTTLTPHDFLFAIDALIGLFQNEKNFDDIDHLENRRVRTSGELIQNQLSLGLIRLEKRLIEKTQKDKGFLKLQNLFTSRAINSTFKEFFGTSPLSQFLDQANPLAELTHKRRLTSVGPGGINRDTAGMAIRGIHFTHYGRICPIETPEGQNAGLVNSIALFTSLNYQGSIETPLYIIYKGQIQKQLGIQTLSSAFTKNYSLVLSHLKTSKLKFLPNFPITAQTGQKFKKLYRQNVHYILVSCLQLISVATSLIPFLEHDDANRTLMGSNMQRQALPLIRPERPVIGTGFEHQVLFYSGDFLQSKQSGLILYASHKEISIFNFVNRDYLKINIFIEDPKTFLYRFQMIFYKSPLKKYLFLKKYQYSLKTYKKRFQNAIFEKLYFQKLKFSWQSTLKTLIINKMIISLLNPSLLSFLFLKCSKTKFLGVLIKKSTILKIYKPRKLKFLFFIKPFYRLKTLSLNTIFFRLKKNRKFNKHFTFRPIFISFLSKYQKNFLFLNFDKKKYNIKSDPISPIKNPFQTKIFLNHFVRSTRGTCLIQRPGYREGQWTEKGDLLTNNFSSEKGELALGQNVLVGYLPWEGYNFEDAILINAKLIYNDIYTSLHIEKYKIEIRETPFGFEQITRQIPSVEDEERFQLDHRGVIKIGSWVKEKDILVGRVTPIRQRSLSPHERLLYDIVGKKISLIQNTSLRVPRGVEGRVIDIQISETKAFLKNSLDTRIESVSISILEYKKIKIGDKVSGRHGNKGIVSKILAEEDMPYFPDGTCLDMILNPLGVPSRMNLGQIYESLLGLIGKKLNNKFKILPFDEMCGYEASRSLVFFKLRETYRRLKQSWLFSPNYPGQFRLFDGRSGINFTYPIMSGVSYMLKLIHLVDKKIHARSTGPYSLVTQQPLRGRSKQGGQRFGEMEVWALEGFGVAYTLQELLTVKSDDVEGRIQILEAVLKYSTLRFGTPESFKVLIRELQALCLDIQSYDYR